MGELVILELIAREDAGPRAASGAAVIVVGDDAEVVGREVAALRRAGGRTAGFVGSSGGPAPAEEPWEAPEAVAEMAAELFPHDDVVSVVGL